MSAPTPPANLAQPLDRLLAVLIDIAILIGIYVAIGIISALLSYIPVLGTILRLLLAIASLFVGIAYYIYFTAIANDFTQNGQTIGKKLRGIKVVKADGSQFSVVDSILRFVLGYFVSSVVIWLGFIWILIDPNKQGWHDKIASTYVVKAE